MRRAICVAAAVMFILAAGGCRSAGPVRGWTETVVIPTYPVGPASELPNFDRREVYPYSRQADLSFERRDVKYKAYMVENEYLRILVLPEIGGRLFAMVDRVTGKDIVYRQVSIKPGLVGLRGAWICGGIEWNFPRSHSVTTHDLVSCQLLNHDDGSVSIVIGDTERTFRMSWTVELRLRPGKALMEARIICRNPTPFVHPAGWWSNAAFPANRQTQILFPFHKITGHGGGGLQDWPIRDGEDLSWYWKHSRATSTFRAAGEEDFIGAYDHGSDVGLLQYADRHVMPGRKWWTWGTNDSGMRWAQILSDDNRPYVELQSGRPVTQGREFDMQPHEEIEFLEYWMPVTRIGPPARVNPEAVVRLTAADGVASVGVLSTGRIEEARIELSAGERLLKRWQRTISPAEPFKEQHPLGKADPDDVYLRVFDGGGREVIAHRHGHYARGEPLIEPRPRGGFEQEPEGPDLQTPAGKLAHAITLAKQASFAEAKESLTELLADGGQGVDTSVTRYYLGVVENHLGRPGAALSAWDAVSADGPVKRAALMEGAKLMLAEAKWQRAIDRLRPLASGRPAHALAQVYTAVAMRKLGRREQADALLRQALRQDPMLLLGQVELALLRGGGLGGLSALRDEQRRIEAATAYMEMRDYATAERLLSPAGRSAGSTTTLYLRAHVAELAGDAAKAQRLRRQAAKASVRGCMPSRLEELAAFRAAIRADPDDAGAHYLAGLVLYSWKRHDDAIAHWRRAGRLGHEDATVYHAIGTALAREDPEDAIPHYERAVKMAPKTEQMYTDLDAAYLRLGWTQKRIDLLERATKLLPTKHELAHRMALAYFDAGRYDEAVKLYQAWRFRVAEGRYELHDHYAMALVGRATDHLAAGRNAEALKDLDAALEYPENLGIGRPDRARGEATVQYWRGVALDRMGKAAQAKDAWSQAGEQVRISRRLGPWRPERALHVVHAALALQRAGEAARAKDLTDRLEEACERFEDFRPPQGEAFCAMIRGYLAAAAGRGKDADAALRQAEVGSGWIEGNLRLVRKWAKLLRPAEAPPRP